MDLTSTMSGRRRMFEAQRVYVVAASVPPRSGLGGTPAQEASDLINRGSKVADPAGRGSFSAGRDAKFVNWLRKVGGTELSDPLGKAVVPDDESYTTGGIGLLGTAPSQEALKECDTLIIAGPAFRIWSFIRSRVKQKQFRSISILRASDSSSG